MKTLATLFSIFVLTTTWSQQWYPIQVPTTEKLNEICFVNNTVGYIVGDATTLLKTIDGGENWTLLNHSGLSNNAFSHRLIDVKFVSELVGFVVLKDDNDGVYKTMDGGLTWTPAANSGSNMCYKSAVYLNSEDDYFVGGAGCFQSGQIDHFTSPNWTISTVNYETFDPNDFVVEMDFNSGIGIAALNSQSCLRSTDNGATWNPIQVTIEQNRRLTSVFFASADTVFMGYEDPILYGFGFYMSTDAGLTWSIQSTIGFFYPAARGFTKANNGDLYAGGIAVNDSGLMFESTDGTNWTETNVTHPINDVASYGNDITFGVGDSGYVIVNTPFVGNVGIESLDEWSAIEMYPNPASNFVQIKNPTGIDLRLEIVSLRGEVLMRDLDGADGTKIDISGLASGVYYVRSSDGKLAVKVVKM